MKLFTSLIGALHTYAFRIRFNLRSAKWRPALARARPINPTFIVSGYFNEALGIGRAGHLVSSSIEASGHKVIREDLRPFDRGLLTRSPKSFPEAQKAQVWLMEANAPETKIALFGHDYAAWKDLYRIAVWHWESSLAPSSWLSTALWFHEIWVTSPFVKEVLSDSFRKAGMEEQIPKLRLKPLPVPVPTLPIREPTSNDVRVITLFDPRSHFERKNPDAVISAWKLAFPQSSGERHLIVKALAEAADYPAFQDLKKMANGRTDITFLCETLDAEKTERLIGSCDILISLHRGEGFGLTMAEAMALGKSVIATGWSGNLQFMNSKNSILVPYRLIPAVPRYNGPEAHWAEPDVDYASNALRELVGNSLLRQQLGISGREDIITMNQHWSPQRIFPEIHNDTA